MAGLSASQPAAGGRLVSRGGERLKPQIVHALASAELYCSCLANIYADPNYHNLSHWGIIQALARKGVYVAEPSDVALTETVLIQTGPIKMSAHMAVMEAIMALYIREVITAERVVGVVRRFTQLQASTELPADQEEALLLWINKACARLRLQIAAECRAQPEEGGVPSFPLQQDMSDLSDGTCLAGLVALYCPDELSWPEVAFSDPPRIADSLYNLQLLEKFCHDALPYNPHFLTLEDILYMHSSVKQNLLVLLADLFYLFEINPAKCVRQPVMGKERVIEEMRRQGGLGGSPRRSQPDLRGSASQASSFSGGKYPHSEPSVVMRRSRGSRSAERGRQRFSMFEGGCCAWASLYPDWWWRCSHPATERCHYCSRPGHLPFEQQCFHHLADAAGRESPSAPSGGSRRPRSVYPGDDRSVYRDDDRSNSEESEFVVQRAAGPLTLSRLAHQRRSQSPPSSVSSTHRDLLKESTISFGDRDPFQDVEQERALSRSASRQSLYETRSDSRQELTRPPSRNLFQESTIKEHFKPTGRRGGDEPADGFRPIGRDADDGGVDIDNRVLDALEREARGDSPSKGNLVIMFDNNDEQKPTSFAELSKVQPSSRASGLASPASEGAPEPDVMASELHSIKLRLEEKRRNIEKEKRRMESAMSRQKQTVGKQAFLQAMGQEMSQNLSHMKDKWSRVPDAAGSPDLDNMDYDQYTSSLHSMNESLTELQDDIQRLSQQQSQMQQMQNIMQNGGQTQPPYQQAYQQPQYQPGPPQYQAGPPPPPPGQFYLHDQAGQRRQWGQPMAPDDVYQHMSPSRARWGQPVRPMMPMQQQYGAPPADPYYQPQRPFLLHHEQQDGGMMAPQGMPGPMAPPGGYHPDYSPRMYGDFQYGREEQGSPRVPTQQPPPPPEKEQDEPSPEVLAAMKVDKIRDSADPELAEAAPGAPVRTPAKTASSGGLLDKPRPAIPPKPKPSAFSLGGDGGGGAASGAPSAFSTYTNGSPASRPLLEKLEVDPNLPPETMRPLRPPSQSSAGVGLVIGDQLVSPQSEAMDEMERKKERILMMSLKRKQDAEAARRRKEEEALARKEDEARKEEEKQRKKEEEKAKKERIFEQYKLKKAREEAEKNGTAPPPMPSKPAVRPRPKSTPSKPRPKSMMDGGPMTPSRGGRGSSSNLQAMSEVEPAAEAALGSSLVRHRSLSRRRRSNIAVSTRSKSLSRRLQTPEQLMYPDKGREGSEQWGSSSSLAAAAGSRRGSNASLYEPRYSRPVAGHSGRKVSNDGGGMRKDGHRTSTGSLSGTAGRPRSRMGPRTGSSSSLYDDDSGGYRRTQFAHSGRRPSAAAERAGAAGGQRPSLSGDVNRTYSKAAGVGGRRHHQSLTNLFGTGGGTPRYSETDSGLGRDTPTRRGVSPGAYSRGVTSPSGPGSLPPGLVSRRRNYGDDAASDTSSMASYDYNGPRLFKQPTTKSNRSILLNAVEYCVFPGAVNREAKQRVLEEIARVEARHFLILFRDARCQFRALYWYEPETDEVVKLYGTGPKMATDKMFDKFFKYNSGGKCFSQIHTKHLSVTIDAFTIHDALWQGKRPSLPSKKDMTLVT
ncbi:patronin-like [Pollicipes pollicipes]|uniref:patronin-like n=1 Tax=Pollicipes pollicipes TaxID=41117 RepID=UPI001884E5ED|nr:patronin-like [Pollicipes pollicipes]